MARSAGPRFVRLALIGQRWLATGVDSPALIGHPRPALGAFNANLFATWICHASKYMHVYRGLVGLPGKERQTSTKNSKFKWRAL